MKRSRFAWVILASGLCGPALAAEEGPVLADILEVLKQRGIVDEGEYQRLAAKNARYEKEHAAWMPEIDWSGDFRFRHESFWYDEDAAGAERSDRYRIRYRFRVKGDVEINEWADLVFRLVSGDEDTRSTNQTLGSGVDFDTDDIRLDLAFARLHAPAAWVPVEGGKLVVEMGKVESPFVWKVGKDFMLWDHDVTLEGASLRFEARPVEATRVFASFGYYIDDENSQSRDPHFWGLQAGAHHEVGEDVTLGGRVSWYEWRSIDAAFNGRGATGAGGVTAGGGNIADGLNGDLAGNPFSVVEGAAYVQFDQIESWPIVLHADYSRNLDAERSLLFPGAGGEDTAWGVGVEAGSSKEIVKLGAGYWHIEANAWPAMFIDSDLFDGVTNRKGWALYGSREVLKNTELTLTLFISDEIEDTLPPFLFSATDARRVRLQADMAFKF